MVESLVHSMVNNEATMCKQNSVSSKIDPKKNVQELRHHGNPKVVVLCLHGESGA